MRRAKTGCRIDAAAVSRVTNEQTFPPRRNERRGEERRGEARKAGGSRGEKTEDRRRRRWGARAQATTISRDKRHHEKARVNTRCAIVCHGRAEPSARDIEAGKPGRRRDERIYTYTHAYMHREENMYRGWRKREEGRDIL